MRKQLAEAKSSAALSQAQSLVSQASSIGQAKILVARLDNIEAKAMQVWYNDSVTIHHCHNDFFLAVRVPRLISGGNSMFQKGSEFVMTII